MPHVIDSIIILAVIGAISAAGHTAYLVMEWMGG